MVYWHSSIENLVDSNLALGGELNGGYEEVRRIGKGVEGVKWEDFEFQAVQP